MKLFELKNMVKGWFVGNFEPTILDSKDFEVAIKKYEEGDYEEKHYHKVATEITVVIGGPVEMNGVIYYDGQIVVIEPGDATDFKALKPATTVVVKAPSAKNDKYMGDPEMKQLSFPFAELNEPKSITITSDLFDEDFDSEEDMLKAYSDPEFIIKALENKVKLLQEEVARLKK